MVLREFGGPAAMVARHVGICLLLALGLSACAKQPPVDVQAAATMPPAVADPATSPPAAAKPTDDGLLPSDPIANQPPMPVALLEQLKAQGWQAKNEVPYPKGNAPLPATGVAFRGSIDDNPFRNRASAFLASSDPVWTPVDIVETDDHLPPDALGIVQESDPYTLDAGDRVRIFVYGQPNLSRTYPIDVSGTISMPLIGAVKARGLTVGKLKARIVGLLAAKYVRDPQLAVEVTQYRPFFILGEVRNAGQYSWVNGLTIQSAVAIAGGFSPRATERSVRLTRLIDGVQSEIDVPTSYAVRPGDVIYVKERFF